jgi:hypothetical protein
MNQASGTVMTLSGCYHDDTYTDLILTCSTPNTAPLEDYPYHLIGFFLFPCSVHLHRTAFSASMLSFPDWSGLGLPSVYSRTWVEPQPNIETTPSDGQDLWHNEIPYFPLCAKIRGA